MPEQRARRALAALVAALAIGLPGLALAHGGHTGPAQTFTQDIGPYTIAITVEIPSGAPAPLYLNVAPLDDMGGTTMRFRAVPRGQSFAGAPEAELQGLTGPQGIYYTQLAVDRMGEWELEARVDGPKGGGAARIPFTIEAPALAPGSLGLFVALGGLVLAMIASIAVAAISQRRGRPAPGWLSWAIGQAMFACLIAALIFGGQQFSAMIQSAQAASGAVAATAGRPHANLSVRTAPAAPLAGQPITLTLDLSDGSTGLPVEDLIAHHDALLHLVVISQDGGFYSHTHPPRSAPGRFSAALAPDRPGRYTVYAEIERRDSGTQVLARDFEVGGAATAAPPQFAGLGPREAGGMQVNVASSTSEPKAGRQATFTFSFSSGGKPVDDLQPWLGMGGHMIARSDDGAIFAHIHAVGPMAPAGLIGTGVNYGPDIRFVYTFPQPGRYQIWGQFRHAGQIVTVPLAVDVK
ncbi:MAG TPA: hypothetical protein PKK15_14140 [Kouleothrix sp.]|uniref:hypothetical protein n=1 Tax=Kouleothrix sp. TaxID=2779161 RepID=UPI002C7ED9F5|nr:hypothetical protein [Kouleothrix sp.]